MPNRRSSGTGLFIATLAAAAMLAIGFVGYLYWQSQQGAPEGAASPAASPASRPPTRPVEPSPTPVSPTATSAHRLDADERLPLGGAAAVRYTPANGAVSFQFEVAGNEWPSVDVDVNQNGAIDANLDRSYTIATNQSFCAQYILSATSWSECGGAPSGGRVSVSGSRRSPTRRVTLTIPADELANDPDTAHVAFKLCHQESGGWECTQSPGGAGVAVDFTEMFAISLH